MWKRFDLPFTQCKQPFIYTGNNVWHLQEKYLIKRLTPTIGFVNEREKHDIPYMHTYPALNAVHLTCIICVFIDRQFTYLHNYHHVYIQKNFQDRRKNSAQKYAVDLFKKKKITKNKHQTKNFYFLNASIERNSITFVRKKRKKIEFHQRWRCRVSDQTGWQFHNPLAVTSTSTKKKRILLLQQ